MNLPVSSGTLPDMPRPREALTAAFLIGFAVIAVNCGTTTDSASKGAAGVACSSSSDCEDGLSCTSGVCSVPGSDAGADSTVASDAGADTTVASDAFADTTVDASDAGADAEVDGGSAVGCGAGLQAGSPWPMFGRCAPHGATSPYVGAQTAKQKWAFATTGAVNSSPAIAADGTLYFGSDDKNVYALHADGTKKWSFTTGGAVDSSPAIGEDGSVYVVSHDGLLYALDPAGTKKWSFSVGVDDPGHYDSSPALGPDGTVYVNGQQGLFAITPAGTKKWLAAGYAMASPAVGGDGTIYFVTNDWLAYAIRPDGTVKWSFKMADSGCAPPTIAPDGTVYVASEYRAGDSMLGTADTPGMLYALHPDGTKKWSASFFKTAVRTPPAIGPDGTVYVATQADGLMALDATSGAFKWSYWPDVGILHSSPAVGADGLVYIGTEMGTGSANVVAVDATGKLKWKYIPPVSAFVETSPAIGKDGTIYVGQQATKPWLGGNGLVAIRPAASGETCSSSSDCAPGLSCTSGVCSAPPVDAGAPDVAAEATTDGGSAGGCGAGLQPGSPWPMRGRCAPHGARSPFVGPQTATQKWFFHAAQAVLTSPAVAADGTIYFGSDDTNVYAVHSDGTKKWSFATGGAVEASPAIGEDGTVYATSDDGLLYALDSAGTKKWSFNLGSDYASLFDPSPALGADGTVYVAAPHKGLFAITPTGTQKWLLTGVPSSSPAVGADGTIYFAASDRHAYAVRADGTVKWSFALSQNTYSSPTVAADGTVYVGSENTDADPDAGIPAAPGLLYAINPDGTLKWSTAPCAGCRVDSSPAIGADGTVYIGVINPTNSYLVAVNAASGSLKWSFALAGHVMYGSPAVGADGLVYIGLNGGGPSGNPSVVAVDAAGTLKWAYTTSDFDVTHSSPAIGKDGTLYIGTVGWASETWGGLLAIGP